MGVKSLRESSGDHPAWLVCQNCGTEYVTDETMANDCPDCHHQDWEFHAPEE